MRYCVRMERSEALNKAAARSMTSRHTYLAVCRTDHPAFPGQDYYYVVASGEKHAWTPGEYVVDAFCDGEPVDVPV